MTDKTNGQPPETAVAHDQTRDADGRGGRARTRAEERAAEVRVPTRSELLDDVHRLERELETARGAAEEYQRNWHRSAADFSNFKRRTDEERAVVAQMSTSVLLMKLLTVLDDFDRALANVPDDVHDAWVEGVRLVERKLRGVLESEGVVPIEAIGQPFDPNVHEAVVHEATDQAPDNTVIDELQRGYRLHDRVLRPSLVKVANNTKQK